MSRNDHRVGWNWFCVWFIETSFQIRRKAWFGDFGIWFRDPCFGTRVSFKMKKNWIKWLRIYGLLCGREVIPMGSCLVASTVSCFVSSGFWAVFFELSSTFKVSKNLKTNRKKNTLLVIVEGFGICLWELGGQEAQGLGTSWKEKA